MKQREERINKLIENKTKINVSDCNEATKEIYELYKETNDESILIKYLFAGTYKVASQFIINFYHKIDEDKQLKIEENIIKEISIKEEKVSKCLTGFCVTTTLFNIGKKDSVLPILNKTIELAESGSGFTTNICRGFKSHLLEPIGSEIFKLDYSSWGQGESARFLSFIKKTEGDIEKFPFADELNIWIKTYINEPDTVLIQDSNEQEETTDNLEKENCICQLNNTP